MPRRLRHGAEARRREGHVVHREATGTSTGVHLRMTGAAPEPPATVAPTVRQTVAFPAGTLLRVGALPQCDATDEVLSAQGAEAVCPAESRVGSGRAEGLLAGSVPVTFDLAVYAVRGRLYFAGERGGVPLKQGFFGVPSGRRLVLTVPTMNGAIEPTLFEDIRPTTSSPTHLRGHPAVTPVIRQRPPRRTSASVETSPFCSRTTAVARSPFMRTPRSSDSDASGEKRLRTSGSQRPTGRQSIVRRGEAR
jgi:hypothetical protein